MTVTSQGKRGPSTNGLSPPSQHTALNAHALREIHDADAVTDRENDLLLSGIEQGMHGTEHMPDTPWRDPDPSPRSAEDQLEVRQ